MVSNTDKCKVCQSITHPLKIGGPKYYSPESPMQKNTKNTTTYPLQNIGFKSCGQQCGGIQKMHQFIAHCLEHGGPIYCGQQCRQNAKSINPSPTR